LFPVGKVELLTLYPLSFQEFLDGIGDAKSAVFLRSYVPPAPVPEVVHAHLWERLLCNLVVGGLPEAVSTFRDLQGDLFSALQRVRQAQRNLITAYMADMAKHSGKENSMHLERIWRNVPAQLACTQDGSAPKFRFKDVVPGIAGYDRLSGPIDWLLAARLVAKTQIVGSGQLPFPAYAEELTCWRENTAEVEFLREREGLVLPVEVKSCWVTQSKSLGVFARKYNPPYRTILSANNVSVDTENKVHRYPLYLAGRFPFG
jgi:hypothetical protein